MLVARYELGRAARPPSTRRSTRWSRPNAVPPGSGIATHTLFGDDPTEIANRFGLARRPTSTPPSQWDAARPTPRPQVADDRVTT